MATGQSSQCRYTLNPTKQRAGITMDECETVYEEVPVAHATYINLGSITSSVQPDNREEDAQSPQGTAHTEEHTASTEGLGNIVGKQTPTTKQRNIRSAICFLIGLVIGAGLCFAIGYYVTSQEEQNIADTLSRETMSEIAQQTKDLNELQNTSTILIRQAKSEITQHTKDLKEYIMSALRGIHIEVQGLNNALNIKKCRPVNNIHLKTSCAAIQTECPNATNGVYTVYPGSHISPKSVYCDMSTGGGGWTVIQRRQDGSIQFNQTWADYKQGFGSAYGEHWIGNDAMHQLTANESCELRVDLTDWEGQHRYALYSSFRVANETDNYRLTIGGYSGTAGDSLGSSRHNSEQFSTPGRNNDRSSKERSCADRYGAGWWYGACYHSNLNGRYDRHGTYSGGEADGVTWNSWLRDRYSLKAVSMMVRPRH